MGISIELCGGEKVEVVLGDGDGDFAEPAAGLIATGLISPSEAVAADSEDSDDGVKLDELARERFSSLSPSSAEFPDWRR